MGAAHINTASGCINMGAAHINAHINTAAVLILPPPVLRYCAVLIEAMAVLIQQLY